MIRNLIKSLFSLAGLDIRKNKVFRGPPPTFQNACRFLHFCRLFERLDKVGGSIVECGVGHGESLLQLAYLARLEGKNRMVWGFDSFEGFPAPSLQDQSIRKAKKGDAWKECSITTVHEMLTLSGLDPHYVESRIMLVKGFFEQTLSEYDRQPIALLHLDVDLYASYKECLVKLYPLMASGGIIAFDEYKRGLEPIYWPGAAKAIEEFLGDRVRHIQRDPVTGKYYIECGEYINQTASPLRGETGKTRGL